MRRTVIGIVVLLGCVGVAAAQQRVEIYKVRHRLAEELAPAVRAIIKDTGTVTVDPRTNSLILVAPGGRVDLALQVLAQQDAPPRTVVVQYRSLRTVEMERAGVRIRWSVQTGDVRVGNVARPPEGDQAAMALYSDWTEEHRTFSSTLRLLEGATGRIHTGKSEPIRNGQLPGAIGYAVTSSGFQVTTRVLGNGKVRLQLAPVNTTVGPGGTIRSSAALSTVDVTPGDTVVLGNVQRQISGTRVGTSGAHRTEGSEEEILLVRVQVE
jgi:hypothetical protein